jgi:protein transport protein SEC61 subunit alpha
MFRERGAKFWASVIALFRLLITRSNKVCALREAFYRHNLQTVTKLFATVLVFLIIIYFQCLHVVLPVRSKNSHGQQGSYPIKLFYVRAHHSISLMTSLYSISQVEASIPGL